MTYLQATFEDKLEFNDFFVKYSFELKNPHHLPFVAGQTVKIKLDMAGDASSSGQAGREVGPRKIIEREYFICSSPAIDHGFEILVERNLGGRPAGGDAVAGDLGTSPDSADSAAAFFDQLEFGSVIDFTGPAGDFVLKSDQETELILVGTGVGVAPLYSMVQDLLQVQQSSRPITLFWGLETLDQLFMTEDLSDLARHFPNFSFHPVIAKALPEWSLCRGSVYDCLSVHQINAEADFYICTTTQLAEKIKNLCLTNGVKQDQLNVAAYA